MLKVIIKPLALSVVCFFAGYQFASMKQPSSEAAENNFATQSSDTGRQYQEQSADEVKRAKPYVDPASRNFQEQANDDSNISENSFAGSVEYDNIDDMLNDYLNLPAGSGEQGRERYEAMKTFVSENPESGVELITQLDSNGFYSDNYYTALSLLKSLPIEQADELLLSHAEQYQYSNGYDAESRDKFLGALENVSQTIESETMVRSLVDIAIDSDADLVTTEKALSLVPSHQLLESEKNDIGAELSRLIDNSDDEQTASNLLPHLMRFSKKEDRSRIASDFLSRSRSEATRYAVISGVSAGEVPANDEMKERLFEIASSSDDPLSDDAAETLKYNFELTREEYNRLRN